MFAACGVPDSKFRTICSAVDKLDKVFWNTEASLLHVWDSLIDQEKSVSLWLLGFSKENVTYFDSSFKVAVLWT